MTDSERQDHDAAEVLRARARALARTSSARTATASAAPSADGAFEVVEFRLAHERYAVPRDHVREVQPLKDLTPLPGTPAFMLGVVNVRGQILPVIDVKRFFDLPDAGITDLHAVVVVGHDDIELGILADLVVGIQHVSPDRLQASLPTLTGIRARYLKGVTDEQVVLLDVPQMLADPRLIVDDDAVMAATGAAAAAAG